MLRPLYALIFKIIGWKVVGGVPNIKKFVIAVAPHTSNWDFPVGVAARSLLRIRNAQFLGKSQLFRPPFGWFFRMLGGHPVKRTTSEDMVDQVVKIFNRHSEFILAMAPEGTRKKVDRLRTGFYYIAKGAGVPVVPVGFDYARKEVIIGEPIYLTHNFDADMDKLMAFYRPITGKNPELGLG
ncbi:MAG: lysophospholipid acyltransferase family protein [Bacteroidetes bacterium]|nr:lysophospholipid acyltransferase family protein [Bacteroidota bacterium]MBS1979068.1 lysophospholipid acyltransferase family protein [Bacteroidota bacterium]